MENKFVVSWLKDNLECAKFDFSQMKYDDDDTVYEEDDDKCKIGYVVGYKDAINMLIKQAELFVEK